MSCDCGRVPVDCCPRWMPRCATVTVLDADGTVNVTACADGHGCAKGLGHSGVGCGWCGHE